MSEDLERRGPGRPRLPQNEPAAIRTDAARPPIRERKRKGGNLVDKFEIPKDMIPPGMSYEWKRETVFGKSDPSYDVLLREQGWEPVSGSRHPEYVLKGSSEPIRRDGLILMERPVELTNEARLEDSRSAYEAVRAKEQQLGHAPSGTLPRDVGSARPDVRRSYEPVSID